MPTKAPTRALLLTRYFAVFMALFAIQKILFMLYNAECLADTSAADILRVLLHALRLDATVAAYALVVPLLTLTASRFFRFSLRKWLAPYFATVWLLMTVVMVADALLYGFWGFKIDSTVFAYTDKPAGVLASVDFQYVAKAVFSALVTYALGLSILLFCTPKTPLPKSTHCWYAFLAVPGALVLFLLIRGGVGAGTANVSMAYFSDRQFLNHSAVNPVFNMIYSLMHQRDFAREFRFFHRHEDVAKHTHDMFFTSSNNTEKVVDNSRPNVLFIVWEGCGGKVAGCIGAEADATPQLDSIARSGVLFSQCYSTSFRTDRGLVSINSGWPSLPTASLMKMPEKCERLPGLARSLKACGYSTDFWYGGDITFTNMSGYMLQNGFQRTRSDRDFVGEKHTSRWGADDEVVFNRLLADIARRHTATPWFTEVLTLSSHEPWAVPYRRLQAERENSFAYTDHCLGQFLNRLRRLPQWHNTLVVITADHGVRTADSQALYEPQLVRIPVVLTGGAVSKSLVVDKLMSQMDIAATLLGQLGIAHDDFPFSRDVLSQDYRRPTAMHTNADTMTFYDASGITTLDLTTLAPIYNKGGDALRRTDAARAMLQMVYEEVAR